MYRNFEKLPDNKKELILKAAAEEFVEKGYYNANTEIIAKKSKISKGSLFNYFKSKKGFYIFVEYTRKC